MKSLRDAVAVVTGASSGIGEAVAKMLAAEGARVSLTARREDELERVAGEIRRRGGEALVVPADMQDQKAAERIVERTVQVYGPIEILVNNAGVYYTAPVHALDMQQWDTTFSINLRAPAALCRAVLPQMRERRAGAIINIASEAGALVYGGMGAYAVSKHALRVLTELIQEENQALGIKAWAICPGYVDTSMASSSEGINVGNILATDDIAEIVRFLLLQGDNVKMGPEILVRTMRDPHARSEPPG